MTLRHWAAVFGVLGLLGTPTARAADELRERLKELAPTIREAVANAPVRVGQFAPSGLSDSNYALKIEETLRDELRRLSPAAVADDSTFEVKGDYQHLKDQNGIVIDLTIKNLKTGKALANVNLHATLTGTDTVAEVLGVTGSVSKPADLKKDGLSEREQQKRRQNEVNHAKEAPAVVLDGTRIKSTADSPYAVEILVKPLEGHETVAAKPRAATTKAGSAFVKLDRGELYELRLHNDSGKPAAVKISIDGLDVFHFSQDRNPKDAALPKFTHHILGFDANNRVMTTGTVVGWFNAVGGDENYKSFLVTALGQGTISKKEGVAARAGRVGVIHLAFSEAKELPPGGKAAGGNETDIGPPRKVAVKPVAYEIEPPHEFITVRYNPPKG